MNNWAELTEEEKNGTAGGFFLGPIVINLVDFYNNVANGFSKGLTDGLK